MKRNIPALFLVLLLLFAVTGCESAPAEEPLPQTEAVVIPDPNPPVVSAEKAETSPEPVMPDDSGVGSAGAAADEPAGEILPATEASEPTAAPIPTVTPVPTAAPAPTPIPLRAGTYEGSDGSILVVKKDGTCTYETELSGTINGTARTERLTFHGTVTDGVFSFTRVTFGLLDLTKLAAAAGYDDASYWEQAAAILYAGS